MAGVGRVDRRRVGWRRPIVAATAFANSQAMPVILIDVIGPALFGAEGSSLGIAYVGLYMIVYLLLQWTIGAALLDVPLLTVGGGERSKRAVAKSVPQRSLCCG